MSDDWFRSQLAGLTPLSTPLERAYDSLRDTVNKQGSEIAKLKAERTQILEIAMAVHALARALTPPKGDTMAKAAKKTVPKLVKKPKASKKPAAKRKAA